MNRAEFFNAVRVPLFKGRLTADQVNGLDNILDIAIERDTPVSHLAYILATSFWETGRAMQPVREVGRGRGRRYGVPGQNGGQVPYGRGDVQLTWDYNYERADRELGLNGALIKNYDLALDPVISKRIMFLGMEQGWFTTRKLRDYDRPNGSYDFVEARRIINGTDKALKIAGFAQEFRTALRKAGYSPSQITLPFPVREQEPVVAPSPAPSVPAREPQKVSWWAKIKERFRG